MPLVSIGLPTYNGLATIERALQSLTNQTYPAIEIIVCDDASDDSTPNVCREFAKSHPFIRFEENLTNLGVYPNMLKTLRLAIGQFVLWADEEDQ